MDKQAGRLLYTGAGLANWVGAISVWEQSSGHQYWVGGGYSGHFYTYPVNTLTWTRRKLGHFPMGLRLWGSLICQ